MVNEAQLIHVGQILFKNSHKKIRKVFTYERA